MGKIGAATLGGLLRWEKEKGILTGKGSDILYHYAFFYAMRTQTFGRPTKRVVGKKNALLSQSLTQTQTLWG